jgi:branched-subunit amino acid aminotransferase/4-amino-4-deoxychorismate lyase
VAERALLEDADAMVSAFDHGMTAGDGGFETVKVWPGGYAWPGGHARQSSASTSLSTSIN